MFADVLEEFRENCSLCICPIMIYEIYKRLHPLYTHLEEYGHKQTEDGVHATKLEALLDPNRCYDGLRCAFFRPGPDASVNVSNCIMEVVDMKEFNADVFDLSRYFLRTTAEGIRSLNTFGNADVETNPPENFEREAFDTYLFALGTEGHEYYLAPEELLSVAEAIHANVVITRESATHFEVGSYNVGAPGENDKLV